MTSNLTVSSNLMLDDAEHKPEYRFLPGDYVGKIYPTTVWVGSKELSDGQRIELEMYLVCLKCGRTCAGTCEMRPRR